MYFIVALLLSFSAFAQVCEPVITLRPQGAIVLKEGHRQEQAAGGVYLEMDRYCAGENITVTVLLKSGSAIVGEHVSGQEINQVSIPAGQIVTYLNFAVIGDNEWNEDREFSVQAINPSRGTVDISTVDFAIKNDDPKITIVVANKVTEPRKGSQTVELSVQLSMPAEQRITGEIEFSEQTATRGVDFEAPFNHSFEILPGEKEFTFLPKTLIVYSDDEKEKDETLRLFLNNIQNATPSNGSALIVILDPKNFQVTFTSEIKATSGGQVAMTAKYSFTGDTILEANDGSLSSLDLVPSYSHSVAGLPGPVRVSPGRYRISLKAEEENLSLIRLEFIESPFEIYPYMTQQLFMYMSSFGKLHEDEFITVHSPGTPSYPAFEFKKMVNSGKGTWKGIYNNRLSDGGSDFLIERTEILVKELE